jgi:hypothetical protein
VEASLGITLRTGAGLPESLRALDADDDLSSAHRLGVSLSLHDAKRAMSTRAKQLRSIVIDTFEDKMPKSTHHNTARISDSSRA